MKLLKTIRLDLSDTLIFPKASENEWAVIGTFAFWDKPIDLMTGKERQAFRAGFLGVETLGFSTLVSVEEGKKNHCISMLCESLLNHFGAPSKKEAELAAIHEVEQAIALADHPVGTLIAMHRTFENGEYREVFRTLTRKEAITGSDSLHSHAKAFTFLEVESELEEQADLLSMIKNKKND